ncbi:hypothetical protein DBV23_09430 [Edwardsiella ictaluri]|nr:hypothetical protein DBV23_09430 [Edwardsiella ictaluri]
MSYTGSGLCIAPRGNLFGCQTALSVEIIFRLISHYLHEVSVSVPSLIRLAGRVIINVLS